MPAEPQHAAEHLRQLGKSVEYYEIPGDGGHIDRWRPQHRPGRRFHPEVPERMMTASGKTAS
jgi:hypothetical protein